LDSAISIVPRTRACRFSSATPVIAVPWSAIVLRYASTIGATGTVSKCSPVRPARSAASLLEWSEEYSLGIETAYTFCAPRASTAIAATSAESMPPESPKITEPKPFLAT
jgi:hypothetical protein